jgi:hypothetical protein
VSNLAQKVVWLQEQDLPAWDAFVERHPNGWVTHLSAWKHALESSFPRIRGRILTVVDGDPPSIVAGLPLYYSQDLISGRTLVSVPYGTICDPLFDTPPQLSLLSDKLLDLGKRAGGAIEVRSMNGDCGALQSQGFGVSRCYWQHSVDLERDVQTIYASFHRSCVRQQIAKAEKSGFQSRIGCNEQDLRRFFRLFSGTRQSLGLPVLPWRFIDCLWHGLSEQRRIGIALSFVGSQAVAALLLLRFGKRVSAECLGWDRRF